MISKLLARRGGCSGRPIAPFLGLWLALACIPGIVSADPTVGSVHDFTDEGLQGGSCRACHFVHGALDPARLYPRTEYAVEAPRRLCGNCHGIDGQQHSMPTTDGFPSPWPGLLPPPIPPSHVNNLNGAFANCTLVCHRHR